MKTIAVSTFGLRPTRVNERGRTAQLLRLLAITALMGSCQLLFATSITVGTFTIGPSALPFAPGEPLGPFPQFDSTLGQLIDVDFEFTSTVSGTVLLDSQNGSDPFDLYNVAFTASISILDPSSTSILVTDTSGTWSLSGQTVPADPNYGTGSAVFTPFTSTGTGSDSLITSSLLSEFIGTGTVVLPVTAQGTASASGPIPFAVNGSGNASTSVTVVYDYSLLQEQTPDPSTFDLFGVGIACVVGGALRKRRQRTSQRS